MNCENAKEMNHRVLDGELMDAERRQIHEAHLDGCPLCRAHREELRQVQSALSMLPGVPLSDDALEDVLARTVRAPRETGGTARPRWTRWGLAAAAAAILVVGFLGGTRFVEQPQEEQYTADDVARAAEDARLALNLTAQALRTGEKKIIEGVSGRVAPALQRVPLRLPANPTGQQENSNNDV
jgi:anti-sigma factor RsiW